MRFRDEDVTPNREIPLADVRVGATSDARWRDVANDPRYQLAVAMTMPYVVPS